MTNLKSLVRAIPDYPKPGILFRDITTLLRDARGFSATIEQLADRYRSYRLTQIAGIEARGFILGGALAHRLGTGFVPIRKKGKLPAKTIGQDYALEYGTDRVELHVDAVTSGDRVLLIDDLIATGGTAVAGLTLLRQTGATVVESAFVIELPELGGRKRLAAAACPVFALMDFEGH